MQFARLVPFAPVFLAACVAPSAPPPASPQRVMAPPPPAPVPVARPAVDWPDRTPAPGVWTYVQDARGSIARYGVPGMDARFTLRCDARQRRIYASRAGTAAARMTLRATTAAKAFDALPTGGTPPYVAASIAPGDPQLDAMAFSRGRILIGLDGADDLIMPIWPEFARVVEDCRG